ncbi:F0F1 ATP synthase subunit epsilon [Candidatus Venteria ishoeyi]|uniref:ATP synthase epsilon chain n=1 Tax=Candidatus Venteria ishoeyi TaxID=1899563 RepID=A0A1H6FF70_9GAMM|nr:F0F1 ATP synthase subunit epsilon [Candidatus Venteria ishoeyi]MDM8547376.1 F0F1 ATP synthase subunit epsilon [Candidatus Venteria ishoeyi]SEH08728.1 ATP synthase epsilon chain [Candidatus Venteria ishoeyi]
MTMTVHVDIVSAKEKIFSGLAEMVFAPAVMGEVGISPRHAPLLTTLKPGEVRVQIDPKTEESYFISGGMLEIQPHTVTVLADTALRAKDLDEAAALKAKEQAEALLANKQSDIDYAKAQAELIEAMAQIQAIEKLRKRIK